MNTQPDARGLLERLASDDSFRDLMNANPAEAFAQYGFVIDANSAPEKVQLPSKEEILANLDSLSEEIAHTVGYAIFIK